MFLKIWVGCGYFVALVELRTEPHKKSLSRVMPNEDLINFLRLSIKPKLWLEKSSTVWNLRGKNWIRELWRDLIHSQGKKVSMPGNQQTAVHPNPPSASYFQTKNLEKRTSCEIFCTKFYNNFFKNWLRKSWFWNRLRQKKYFLKMVKWPSPFDTFKIFRFSMIWLVKKAKFHLSKLFAGLPTSQFLKNKSN